MSLGGGYSSAYDDAIRYAVERGVVVVASAGNNRQSGNAVNYPAASPGAFAIAASESTGRSAPYSYSGATNLVTAPGSYVHSTSSTGGYGAMSGTSMAAPNASAVIARYRDAHPAATVAQIRALVQATAIDMEALGRDDPTALDLAFGVPLAEHEYIQDKLVDMKLAMETSRWLAYSAAAELCKANPASSMQASLAKLAASEGMVRAGLELIQLFGEHSADDLHGTGKAKIKDELTKRVGEAYHGEVVAVYFTELVIP